VFKCCQLLCKIAAQTPKTMVFLEELRISSILARSCLLPRDAGPVQIALGMGAGPALIVVGVDA
jgi:hypothetical protein